MTDLPIFLSSVVEGPLDETVVRRLTEEAGLALGPVHVKNGKDQIRLHLSGYNNAAHRAPWLVLVDLDDKECAPGLRGHWLPEPAPWMCFRIAIRSVESWLLADVEGISGFLSIDPARVPPVPEMEIAPKRTLVELARQSRDPKIRRDLAPSPGSRRGRSVRHIRPVW
ncbi:MAG TPA: hypothetical protein VGM86_02535 [Thermoanaerobaculia bacterium]|jgi:hypothetical protein